MDDVRDPKTATRRSEQTGSTKAKRRGRERGARTPSLRYALHHQRYAELDAWLKARTRTIRRAESTCSIATTSSVGQHPVRAPYTGPQKRREMMKVECYLALTPPTASFQVLQAAWPSLYCQNVTRSLNIPARQLVASASTRYARSVHHRHVQRPRCNAHTSVPNRFPACRWHVPANHR